MSAWVLTPLTLLAALLLCRAAQAQTTWTLDATSGSSSISTSYTTTGGLTLNMGFFVDYLVVGSGGGGGGGNGSFTNRGGGGGSGGQVVTNVSGTLLTLVSSATVTVGAGGPGGTSSTAAASGSSSSIAGSGFTTITALGGGAGGGATGSGVYAGTNGGGDVNLGGDGLRTTNANSGRTGGAGVSSTITGGTTAYGGGGSAGGNSTSTGSLAGPDGGGTGAAYAGTNISAIYNGVSGANGGGGGGAGGSDNFGYSGGSGGSGAVLIRYAGNSTGVTGGTPIAGTGSAAGYTIQRFNTSGTFTFSVDFNSRLGATLSNGISGSGDFTYNGPGTLTLAADSSYVGATTIAAGTLRVGAGGTSGSLGSGSVTNNGSLVFNRSNAVVFADQITGTGSLIKQGGSTLTLSGTNSYSGGTTISAGRIIGTTASLQGAITNNAAVEFSQAASGTYSGNMSGSGSLTKAGTGVVTLSGSNTFSGGATLGAGVLSLGSANALGSSGTISFGGGTLQYSASNAADYSNRFSTAAGQQYSIDTNSRNVTLGSALTSSGGSFTKSGAGNLILTATSNYTGPTSVSAGRLSVNGALGNTAVTVASGAELGGSGSIVGPVSILSGGTLAPGNSIDSLAGGATSFAAGSTFGYEVNSSLVGSLGTAADLLVVNGNLDIASGSLLTFADITSGSVQPFIEDTTVFAMINYSGNWNGGLFTYDGNELADGERFSVGSQRWEIDYNYAYNTASPTTIRPANFQGDYLPSSGTQTFVAITAVPEPGTLVLAGLGLALATVAFRRRR